MKLNSQSTAPHPPAPDTVSATEDSPGSPSIPRLRHHFGRRANAFMQHLAVTCLPVAYFLAWFVVWGFWMFDSRSRSSSCDYLRRIHPRKRPLTLWWRSHRHMYEYAVSLIDSSVILAGHGEGFSITCPNRDALNRAAALPGGLLILTAHVGTIEVVAPRLSQLLLNRRAYFVMYQDMSDATEQFRSENWRELRPYGIINSMDPLRAGIQIARTLMAGEVVGMRADRKTSGKSIGVDVLGSNVFLPHGPFMAAVATGANVVFAFAFRTGRRAYEFQVSEPRKYEFNDTDDKPATIEKAANEFASALTDGVRRFPYQWFNFYPYWVAESTPESSKMI